MATLHVYGHMQADMSFKLLKYRPSFKVLSLVKLSFFTLYVLIWAYQLLRHEQHD
jgi:hypothetical protein